MAHHRQITMFAGDRETVRHAELLIKHVQSMLDGIDDHGMRYHSDNFSQALTHLEHAENLLRKIHATAVSQQVAPGDYQYY